MGSSRLPGKVMRQILETPLLGHLLNRLERAETLTGVVVATSTNPENDVIESYCRLRQIACFRGSEDDVLGRMVGALDHVQADVGVEVFGDCPLIDPEIVDGMVRRYLSAAGALDWIGNDLKTSYPPGMEVEVFSAAKLLDAANRTDDRAIREHGTLFIRQHPEIYNIQNVDAPDRLRRPDLSLEVDTDADLDVIARVLENFREKPSFSLSDIIDFLDANPRIADRNRHVPRRWKQYRSDETHG
jgi:spore coat polysaccharide biosynthesis protein SpsF (cytidylyltransferase family)